MKAILVIESPTVCGNCRLEQYCVINHKSYSYCGAIGITTRQGEILRDCPLKTMPQRKKSLIVADGDGTRFEEPTEFEQGYNSCIDEILGEEE